jgi:acetamidase/formamidase
MTKEEQKHWDDAYAPLIAHDKEQNDIKVKCLDYVKTQVTTELNNDIIEYIKVCVFTDRFEITEVKPNDKCKQKEDFDYLKEVWVDQYCNGGYVGDDFAGLVNIKINKKEYLKFHYSM